MIQLWRAIIGSMNWNKAIDLVREQRYADAIEKLYKIQTNGPLAFEVSLLLAVCHLNLKENELARPTLRHAHDLLNKFKHKFSHSDFEYLSAYTYVASQVAISDDDSKTYTPPNWNEVDLSSVSRVRAH